MTQQPKATRAKSRRLTKVTHPEALERLERFERLIEKLGAPKPRLRRADLPSRFPRIR